MRRAALLASLVGLWMAIGLSGCGIPLDDKTQAIADQDVPPGLLGTGATTTTSTTAPPGSTTAAPEIVHLYLVRNDRIERRTRSMPTPVGIADRLEMLGDVLPAADTDAGYRSAVPPDAFTTNQPSLRGGVATVDLSPEFTAIPTKEQVLAFAQITYTLTDLPGIGQVSFTLNGAPINALDDEGVSVTGPVTEDTYRDLLVTG